MTTAPQDPALLLGRLGVSRESLDRLKTFVDLLLQWQKHINLIGPSTIDTVWWRHILDSVQLLPLLPPATRSIAELGSGAGIPGLILAIAGNFEVHLYESNGKKAAFLREAIRKLGLSGHVHSVRLESLVNAHDLPDVQCVVARALAPLPLLLDYASPFLTKGAIGLFHKGQDVDIELTDATKYWKLQFLKHPSLCDSRGVILEIKEATRV
ncbi:16S rRNA (guanine(527)-N(7))-methyltransferase RsmG [Aestuariivirga sp.]|uniref:16S rRNA (guanine(527)-N(7))-methyltransferase RsmG n=1 Tax=Aestuariivirga sp. TaxID=2650926 RepID=UPI0035937EAD